MAPLAHNFIQNQDEACFEKTHFFYFFRTYLEQVTSIFIFSVNTKSNGVLSFMATCCRSIACG